MTGYTIPKENIEKFLRTMRRYEINMHSVLMMQGDEMIFEKYWKPFSKDTIHRMYSDTKSFVGIAVGCLLDEGKIALDDPIVKYFPDKQPEHIHPWMAEQTIRHMLTMHTCLPGCNWFQPGVVDRTKFYFAQRPNRPAGTLYNYDSTGSYILGALAERLSGMPLLDYMKEKFLNRIGGFENAQMLQVPDGVAWGDSAMVCTPRALLNFAKLLMNGGKWEGEQLISEEYVRAATSYQVSTDMECIRSYKWWGYGYQIWMAEQGGFAFHGMGGQFAVCVPKKEFIFVCTGDNQFNEGSAETTFRAVFDQLIPDDEEYPDSDELPVAHGRAESPFAEQLSGRTFDCAENDMGIKWFRFEFENGEGCFVYENAQGEKRLPFGMKKNLFVKFPQLGYSDSRGNVHDEASPFMYDCASSAGWLEEKKLQLRVQIIDRYFGSMTAVFGFRDENTVAFRMLKHAEDFLKEYDGWCAAAARQ